MSKTMERESEFSLRLKLNTYSQGVKERKKDKKDVIFCLYYLDDSDEMLILSKLYSTS